MTPPGFGCNSYQFHRPLCASRINYRRVGHCSHNQHTARVDWIVAVRPRERIHDRWPGSVGDYTARHSSVPSMRTLFGHAIAH